MNAWAARMSGSLALGLLCMLTACASHEFLTRDEIPGMQLLASNKENFPSETFRLLAGEVAGGPIHLAAEEIRRIPGADSPHENAMRRVLVFLHGVLTDRRTWQYVAGQLGKYYDLLLIDLPGCGDSDKPDVGELGPDAYSPTWLADRVMTSLGNYLRAQDDEVQLTLVGHSLGGTIALRMLAEPGLKEKHGGVYARIDSAVMLAPYDVSGIGKADPAFQTIATLTDIEAFLGRALGIMAKETSAAVYFGTSDPATMPREEWLRLYEILSNGETRTSAQWMLRNTLKWDDNQKPDWKENQVHERHYADVDVPCQIIWGKWDETVEAFMGYKLQSLIRDSRLVLVPRSKHALPSERPRLVANYIDEFLRTVVEYEFVGQGEEDGFVNGASFESRSRIIEVPEHEIERSDRFKKTGIEQSVGVGGIAARRPR